MTEHKPNINVSSDVAYSVNPRSAGVESGRLQNEWLDCPFSVRPSTTPSKGFQRGFAWEVTFNATDGHDASRKFDGIAESRAQATQLILRVITEHIARVIKQRRAFIERWNVAQQLSERDGVPLASAE